MIYNFSKESVSVSKNTLSIVDFQNIISTGDSSLYSPGELNSSDPRVYHYNQSIMRPDDQHTVYCKGRRGSGDGGNLKCAYFSGVCSAFSLECSERRGRVRENTCGELPRIGPQDRKLHQLLPLQRKHDGG